MTRRPVSPDLQPGTFVLEWFDPVARDVLAIDDIDSIAAAAEKVGWLDRVRTRAEDVERVLEFIAPLAHPDLDEVSFNDHTVCVARRSDGTYGFVPLDWEFPGVEELESGKASWLPGGPCLMAQHESIYRLGTLYWVETIGDAANDRVIAGYFDDPAAGVAAAAAVSHFFSVAADGEILCELDEWPQEE